MTFIERFAPPLILFSLGIALPVGLFFPASPNITLSLCGLSCFLYVLNKGVWPTTGSMLKNFWPLILFIFWALLACTWSLNPLTSLNSLNKILMALFVGLSLHAYLKVKDNRQIMTWFGAGYILTIALLLLDEVLNTYILRSLRGPRAGTPEYYHGTTMLILGFWPMLLFMKKQHASRKLLLFTALLVSIFYMTEHSAMVAILVSPLVFLVVYTSPKFFIRFSALSSVILILGFPFATRYMDPEQVIQSAGSVLVKTSYHHRLFILKRTTNMIFEKPWTGHGLESYRSTFDKDKNLYEEVSKLYELNKNPTLDHDTLGQALHPHNISLQIWFELGAVGAAFFALFLFMSLWRISSLQNKRYEQAAFMGLYASIFIISHISFGAWQTWWLLSIGVMIALTLAPLKRQDS